MSHAIKLIKIVLNDTKYWLAMWVQIVKWTKHTGRLFCIKSKLEIEWEAENTAVLKCHWETQNLHMTCTEN